MQQIMDDIKAVVAAVYAGDFVFPAAFDFAAYISGVLRQEYAQLCLVFLEDSGSTLDHYILRYRVEKIKEWLVYSDASRQEIATRLGFRDARQMAARFRSVTGLLPGHFREIRKSKAAIRDMPFRQP
ncbi:helix-turn-helix domain-containing protein [Chitinophaga solisilvae]|uniref:Helix-turn-helix domain-containing protein n=1 Tax=Chitinophaga solisilvae TaxID=1233460 RepID=A0A433WEP0_9BACT|nr:helix-turn-helix domain-containing protein [Chitinophaga solisilvae]NSL85621.1 helix-turn-helix domain-containing protein [Chitinophaga solisilvae]